MKTIMFIMPTPGFSGAENVILQIIDGLKDKYKFIYVSQKGRINSYLETRNVKHIITKDRLNRKELKHIINSEKPDIIHAVDYRASTIISSISSDIPIISHVHNNPPWLMYINKNYIAYLLASRNFKKILTVSDSIEKEYIFSKIIKSKIINVSNPLSRKEILDRVSRDVEEKIKYDICCIGRTTEQKDPFRFVDIISKIVETKSDIKAVMIGDGSLFNETKDYIIRKNLENNIEMMGFIKNPLDILKQSKVFCLPSKWEGFGLVAFEALTMGKPCYTTPVGGLVEIVDEQCGRLCNSNQEFVEQILKVLNDKAKYAIKSKKAIEKSIKLNNIDKYISKIDEIYKLILE